MTTSRRNFVKGAAGLLLPATALVIPSRPWSQVLVLGGGRPGAPALPDSASPVAGAYYVDPDNITEDAGGNGILVGETGRTGGSAEGTNGTGPFTLAQFIAALEDSTFALGDYIHCLPGNYAQATIVNVVGGGTLQIAATHTDYTIPDANRITIARTPGYARPELDYTSNNDQTIHSNNGGSGPINHDEGCVRWGGFDVTCHAVVWTRTVSGTAHNVEIFDTKVTHLAGSTGGDNIGVWKFDACNDWHVRGYDVVDGGHQTGGNDNEAEGYWINGDGGILEYFNIRRDGTGHPGHHKRQASNIIIRNGVLWGPTTLFKGEDCHQHEFDNVFFGCSGSGANQRAFEGIQGVSGNNPSGYQCGMNRCTITNVGSGGAVATVGGQNRNPANQGKEAYYTRCLIDGALWVGYSGLTPDADFVHENVSNNNQFPSTGQSYRDAGLSAVTSLAAFQGQTTNWVSASNPSGAHDGDSVTVDPTWGTRDRFDYDSLDPTNPQTVNGGPVGVDTSLLGRAGAGYTT